MPIVRQKCPISRKSRAGAPGRSLSGERGHPARVDPGGPSARRGREGPRSREAVPLRSPRSRESAGSDPSLVRNQVGVLCRETHERTAPRPAGEATRTGGEGRERMVVHTHDVLVTGGTLIDPRGGVVGALRPRNPGWPDHRGGARAAPRERAPVDRRDRQAGGARSHRHPRPRVRARHRKVRARSRSRRGPVRGHHPRRPGRPELHDHPGLPALRRGPGREPGPLLHLLLSRRRARGPPVPRALRPGRGERRAHRAGDRGEPRPRQGDQGPRGDRRRLALGGRGDQARQGDLPPDGGSRLRPPGAALAAQGRGRDRRRRVRARGRPPARRGRRPRPPLHPPSGRLRLRRDGEGPPDHRGSPRPRGQGGRRPRLALQLRHGAPRPRRRHPPPGPSGRTCTATTCGRPVRG